ncbi:hypothetical protein HBB16_13950 [Pseudonocardia sp. MCCB 268]|nr:hypothetical protein [Pseudonocardia cytotoxica]
MDDPRRSSFEAESTRGGHLCPELRARASWWVQAADHHDALVLTSWCCGRNVGNGGLLRRARQLGLSATELGTARSALVRGLRDRLLTASTSLPWLMTVRMSSSPELRAADEPAA